MPITIWYPINESGIGMNQWPTGKEREKRC